MQVKHLLLVAVLAFIVACSLNKGTVDENPSESQLYQQTQDDLSNKSYNSVVTKPKVLELRYPFDRYTEQVQLESIYANHKSMEPEVIRATAERFIRLHPQHPSVDYAYYLKGPSSLDQDRDLLVHFLPLDMTKRDPDAACDSSDEFARLTGRFPNGRYAPDAKARMVCLCSLLAAYKVYVDHYYLKRQAYVATANRGRYVVESFQETPAVGDGLAIMVEAYRHLSPDDLASTSLEIPKLNYLDNASLKDGEFIARESEADTRSRLAKITPDLIEGGGSSPYMEIQTAKDVIKQYEDAEREVPAGLKPENQDHSADDKKPENDDGKDPGRFW